MSTVCAWVDTPYAVLATHNLNINLKVIIMPLQYFLILNYIQL